MKCWQERSDAQLGKMTTWLTATPDFASGVNQARRCRREIASDLLAQVDKNCETLSTTRKLLPGLELDAQSERFRAKVALTWRVVRERAMPASGGQTGSLPIVNRSTCSELGVLLPPARRYSEAAKACPRNGLRNRRGGLLPPKGAVRHYRRI